MRRKNYQGIIFDLDGVICHTDRYHFLAWKQIADQLGIHFDDRINDRMRGVSRMDSLEILLEEYHGEPLTAAQKAALAEKKNQLYVGLLQNMGEADLSEEVRKTMDTLRSRGRNRIFQQKHQTDLKKAWAYRIFRCRQRRNQYYKVKTGPGSVSVCSTVSGAVSGKMPGCGRCKSRYSGSKSRRIRQCGIRGGSSLCFCNIPLAKLFGFTEAGRKQVVNKTYRKMRSNVSLPIRFCCNRTEIRI